MAPRRVGDHRYRPSCPVLHHHRCRPPAARRRRAAVALADGRGRQAPSDRLRGAMTALTRLWNVFRRSRVDRELQDELATHLALIEERERSNGATPEEARVAARRRFGSVARLKEECHDATT